MRAGLVSIVFILILIGCSKQPPTQKLPEETQIGANTLGFYLNGEPWIPYDRGRHEAFELPEPELTDEGALKISATRIDPGNSARNWFCIEIDSGCVRTGRYRLSSEICTSPYQIFYYGTNKDKSSESFEIDTLQPHYIEIQHLDKLNKVVAGNFELDAINQTGKRIKIRSGRFDLRYH